MQTRRHRVLPYLGVTLVAAAVHLQTLAFPFLFDDEPLIVNNAFLRSAWSPLRALARHFWYGTPNSPGYYRPLVVASFALNGRLLGWGPQGFHLVNLLLHATNTALLLGLLRLRRVRAGPALCAALLFAVHPAASWPVASVVARVDLLPCFFVLLAWIAFERAASITCALLFLGALLCKESAIAFLAVPLLSPRCAPDAAGGRSGRRPLVSCLTAFVLYLGLRWMAGTGFLPGRGLIDPSVNPLAGLPARQRVLAALALSGRYLLYLVVPARFSDPVGYGAAGEGTAGAAWVVGGACALLAWAAAVAVLWWRTRPAATPLGFGLAAFLPASNLLVPIGSLYALNFLYLPLLGIVLALGDLARAPAPATAAEAPTVTPGSEPAPPGTWRSRTLRYIAAAIVASLGAASFAEARIWRGEVDLFRSWTQRFPRYALAWGGLGEALTARGDPADAIPLLRRALALDAGSAVTHYNLGVALQLTDPGRPGLEEALAENRAAIALRPDYLEAMVNAARILLLLDRAPEAEKEAGAALRLSPGFTPALRNHAEALFRLERYEAAAPEFGNLARTFPTDPDARSAYVVSLIHCNRLDEARTEVEAARHAFPDLAWFDFCLARVEARAGHRKEALELLQRSAARDPSTADWLRKVDDFRRAGVSLPVAPGTGPGRSRSKSRSSVETGRRPTSPP